ncbi:signal recognition particle-docking protein FtsY [Sporanaerobium hydrogeniformans]|uniref:Signal recognition particle-docking protein FtsY n=1 Tax=Sporanaerobium hydrogeniformans TaxID=3072179 RepID=A0AC61DCR4_9FIRM|nr:signal recognition particle-docking protein FtsY [Sporanaerobium hydrogeniformans]PHV71114.1 signal recognition particle-docking protein FtsY [Sporanaerobium hydrogeniformans]
MSLFKKLFGKKEEIKPETALTDRPEEGIVSAKIVESIEDGKDEKKQAILEEVSEPLSKVLDKEEGITSEKLEESIQVREDEKEEVIGAPKQGFIKKLFSGLTKTRDTLLKGVDEVLGAFKQIDEDLYEELEEALIMADFGVDTTLHIMEELRSYVKAHKISEPSALKEALQTIITEMIMAQPEDLMVQEGPTVVLVIGVNGAGKTTSIGKLAHLLKQNDKKVLLAAADTFRAAAINQLQVWADRAGVDLIKHEEGSDAAAVVFDAIAAAKSRKVDVLICDTAGRLQNKVNLMKELEKISRIIEKEYPEAKKEILIVLDATTGQNALQQVKLFKEVANINGIILTKLDGTAKGGAIVGIYSTFQVPVKYIGVGEKIDDLQPFDSEAFAKALFKNN